MILPQEAIARYLVKRVKYLFNRRYRRAKGYNVFLNGLTLSKRTKITNDPIILSISIDSPPKDRDPGPRLFSFYYKGPDRVRHQGDGFLVDEEIMLDLQVEFIRDAIRREKLAFEVGDPLCFEKVVKVFDGLFIMPT